MNQDEIKILLSSVRIPISTIELDLGIPAGVLNKAKNGKRGLPAKFHAALRAYIESGSAGVPVVIDPKCMEKLAAEEGIVSPQPAVNFLSDYWMNRKPVLASKEVRIALDKMQGDVVPQEKSLTKFQLELRKKKFGF